MIFHPFVIFIPALVIVLKDTPPLEAAAWVALIAILLLGPTLFLIRRAQRSEQYTYQRSARHQLYLAGEASIVFCAGLTVVLDASPRLIFSLLCLCIWLPLQYGVNARFTKISAHTAIVTGIAVALILMGDLNSPLLMLGAAVVVFATAWARMVTGNHSLTQVLLGIAVSSSAVFLAFGLMELWRPL
jgi:membrane-associated phospholipid phosphatase